MGCCLVDCVGSMLRSLFCWLLALAQMAAAVGVICIIALQLTDYTFTIKDTDFQYTCLLGPDENGRNLCTYGYIVGGVSLGASVILSISVCCGCICWKVIGVWIDVLLSAAGICWWVAASIVFTKKDQDMTLHANQKARDWVKALSWVEVGLWGAMCLVCCLRLLVTVCRWCSCCDCCGDDDRHHDTEAPRPSRPSPKPMQHPVPHAPPAPYLPASYPPAQQAGYHGAVAKPMYG